MAEIKPKFSIITACHNNAVHLYDCIVSVMKQTFVDFEWIIVDDFSSDGSYDILRQIKDPRVRLYRNKDQLFCSSTYARALSKVNADYFGILDADDGLSKNAVKTILKCYAKYPRLSYIYTQSHWCDNRLRPKRSGLSRRPDAGMSIVECAHKKRRHCFSHWRTAKTKVRDLATIFPDNLKWAVDKNMGYALERVGRGGFLNMKLYYYRYHKKNMSLKQAPNQKKTWSELTKKYFEMPGKVHKIIEVEL